jgi:hypothetical protein
VAGQPDAGLHAFGARFVRDETRIFAMGAMFAREHENESVRAVVHKRARDVGQHQLTIPRGDAPRNEQDSGVVRNLPGLAQCLDALAINGRGVECRYVDLAWNDRDPVGRERVTGDHRCCGEVRRRDHPVAARERARPVGAYSRCGRYVGKRGDEPDRDLSRGHAGDPGAAHALGMHDVDPLGCDQLFKRVRAAPELERIGRGVHQRNPFAAEGLEFGRERPILGGDERAGAGLQQRGSNSERGAGRGLLAQGRHDLQDGRAGQCARRSVRVVAFVAH